MTGLSVPLETVSAKTRFLYDPSKPSTFQQWVHGAEAELDNEFVLDTVKNGPPTISSVMDELLRDGKGTRPRHP